MITTRGIRQGAPFFVAVYASLSTLFLRLFFFIFAF